MSWPKAFRAEYLLLRTQLGVWALPWLFFGLVITVMLFALGPFEPELQRFVPRLMVIVALLALFMQTDHLFKPDWQAGSLVQYALSPQGWLVWLTARLLMTGVILGVPLLLWACLAAWLAQVPAEVISAMILGLSLAMPSLFLITALAGALTVALPQAGLLNAIILLPLYLPTLLLTETLVVRAQWGEAYGPFVGWLFVLMFLSLLLLPWAIQRCLRLSLR
jgi:heme exporter protein B